MEKKKHLCALQHNVQSILATIAQKVDSVQNAKKQL